MASRYAQGTQVPVDRSQLELRGVLKRYGSDDILFGESAAQMMAFVQFRYAGLPVRLRIPLPDPADRRFWETPTGRRKRSSEAARAEWEMSCRQQWRVLLLFLKAQLEAVENGLDTPERIFMPYLVLPGGRGTVGDHLGPQLMAAVAGGQLKALPFPEGQT